MHSPPSTSGLHRTSLAVKYPCHGPYTDLRVAITCHIRQAASGRPRGSESDIGIHEENVVVRDRAIIVGTIASEVDGGWSGSGLL